MGFVIAKYNKRILITTDGISHIIAKHPEVDNMLKEITGTLKEPDLVRRSKYDPKVWLYYKFYEEHKRYLSVVVLIYNGAGLLLTSYMTDKVKIGEPI